MRRYRAYNTVNRLFSVDNDLLGKQQSAINAADISDLDKSVICDARNNKSDLVDMRINKQPFFAAAYPADDIPVFYKALVNERFKKFFGSFRCISFISRNSVSGTVSVSVSDVSEATSVSDTEDISVVSDGISVISVRFSDASAYVRISADAVSDTSGYSFSDAHDAISKQKGSMKHTKFFLCIPTLPFIYIILWP